MSRRRPVVVPRGALAVLLAVGSTICPPLFAHTPHDIVHRVRLSPTFDRDRTLLALVTLSDQRLLARSDDAGRTFRQYATPFSHDELTEFAFSTGYADDRTVFAASPFGGLFRSGDGGLSWEPLAAAPETPLDLAVSPAFAEDRTLLCGTARGAYRSTDGGESWTGVTDGLRAGGYVKAVRFAADGGGRVALAAVRERREPAAAKSGLVTGLFASDDGGASWRRRGVLPAPVLHLALSPHFREDGTVAASFGPRGRGVFVSDDGGGSWRAAHDGMSDRHVNELAIADDGTIFAVTKTEGTFRAARAGARWTRLDRGFEELTHQTDDHTVTVAVSNAFSTDGTVVVGMFEGLFTSRDRGDGFEQTNLYDARVIRSLSVAPTFATRPDVFVGSYGAGALVSTDGGETWADRSNGLETLYTSVFEPAPTYADGGPLFFAHQGLWRSDDLGLKWRDVGPERRYGIPRAIGFSPAFATDGTVFLNAGRGSFRSTDAGATWIEMPDLGRGRTMSAVAVSPGFATDRTVFMASKVDGIWRSTDAGDTWSALHERFARAQVRAFALSPAFDRDRVMWAGTPDGLFASRDAGATWSRLTDGLPGDGDLTAQAIAFSPAFDGDGTAFLSTQRFGVFRSDDGGRSFRAANSGLPIDCPRGLAISPAFEDDGTLYLATHDWVWVTQDGGASWRRLPGRLRLDDDHPSIRYEGPWGPAPSDGVCGQGVTASATDGAATTFSFVGNSVEWFAKRGPDGGLTRVELDGEEVGTVDLTAESPTGSSPVFEHRFETTGPHELRLVVIPREEGAGDAVRSDGFAYTF